ncbi:MAG: rRNA methyltransferase [Verrucomicrobiaceae bacterium]|nr:rRNA methyltransferase [Verrucomicrobiaceae bacterium]
MRIPRIYTEQTLALHATIALEADAAHHLSRVLRMPLDAQLILFNGDGCDYSARISSIDKKNVSVTVDHIETAERESSLSIHLGIAVSKGERMDWVIQKATELGVTRITPLISERVEVRLHGEREEKKVSHWRAIAVAACEQCMRNRLPVIDNAQPLSSWLGAVEADIKFVLHHRSSTALADAALKPARVALLIGPEGGLSDSEIAQAEKQDFQSLRLGPRVLRTETAPLAALSILQFVWGDLR